MKKLNFWTGLALVGVAAFVLMYFLVPRAQMKPDPMAAINALIEKQEAARNAMIKQIESGSSVYRKNDAVERAAHAAKVEAQEYTRGLRYALCIKDHLTVTESGTLARTDTCTQFFQ